MRVYVLVDDREGDNGCLSEHGLSLYIEVDGKKILLDNGQSSMFLQNAKNLDIDLDEVDLIVLSHGHYDHGNGFRYLKDGKSVICHPNCFAERYSVKRKEYGGLNISKEELENKFSLILSKEPYRISENIYYLGEIPRNNDFEAKEFPTVYKDGKVDDVKDDSGIVIKTENGLVVISGCAHSGICNTIDYARKLMNESKVYAVVGGFHLRDANEQLEKTIEYFKCNKIDNLYLAHCTSDEVCEKIKDEMTEAFVEVIGSGKKYEL
jgi:7,8-dihydropterin-6-yl-methyl-4-(beta-D-ribofuranosyl)aminobenzene 5'-phosphate synthase